VRPELSDNYDTYTAISLFDADSDATLAGKFKAMADRITPDPGPYDGDRRHRTRRPMSQADPLTDQSRWTVNRTD